MINGDPYLILSGIILTTKPRNLRGFFVAVFKHLRALGTANERELR
jgi:hypothetical protein